MVRFSAPHQDNDHHATEMEWTAIPDHDEGYCEMTDASPDNARTSQHQFSSNACGTTLVPYATQRDADGRDDVIPGSGFTANSLDDAERFSASNYEVHRADNAPPTARDFYQSLQTMHEEYIDNMDRHYFLEEQYERRRRKGRIFLGTIFTVVIVVLYKYAPPPPPVKTSLPFTTFSGKESEGASTRMDALSTTHNTQHHDWGSYCQHTLHIFTQAFIHQLSVFWYALSNAFSYAANEVRLTVVNRASKSPLHKRSDIRHQAKPSGFTKTWCPIRVPAASNRHVSLPRGASSNEDRLLREFSTEEFLRQSIGASLSPQNMALTLLAEGIDDWGRSLVEAAPVSLVHRMSTALETGLWSQEQNGHNAQEWILPPAIGVLLIGPEGVGKLHTARLLGRWLFGHCDGIDSEQEDTGAMNDAACAMVPTEGNHDYCTNDAMPSTEPRNRNGEAQINNDIPDGVIEIIAEDYANNQQHHEPISTKQNVHPIKEKIVNHIFQRQQFGSLIIIHHIEAVPLSLLSDISYTITGKSEHLSLTTPNGREVSASTNGTVFVFTSKQWGTKTVFEEIQRNGMRLSGLRRESLLSSVRLEVDSHLDSRSKMANKQFTIAPFLPFQQEDLKSILRNNIQLLNRKYQDVQWKRLHLSNTALDYFLSAGHVEYFDLLGKANDSTTLTFSLRGATSLHENAPVQMLHAKLSSIRRRPYKVAFVDVISSRDESWETVLAWCDDESLESCEEEWRLVLE